MIQFIPYIQRTILKEKFESKLQLPIASRRVLFYSKNNTQRKIRKQTTTTSISKCFKAIFKEQYSKKNSKANYNLLCFLCPNTVIQRTILKEKFESKLQLYTVTDFADCIQRTILKEKFESKLQPSKYHYLHLLHSKNNTQRKIRKQTTTCVSGNSSCPTFKEQYSKKNSKANYNPSGVRIVSPSIQRTILKEKFESKLQPCLCAGVIVNIQRTILKEKFESKLQLFYSTCGWCVHSKNNTQRKIRKQTTTISDVVFAILPFKEQYSKKNSKANYNSSGVQWVAVNIQRTILKEKFESKLQLNDTDTNIQVDSKNNTQRKIRKQTTTVPVRRCHRTSFKEQYSKKNSKANYNLRWFDMNINSIQRTILKEKFVPKGCLRQKQTLSDLYRISHFYHKYFSGRIGL